MNFMQFLTFVVFQRLMNLPAFANKSITDEKAELNRNRWDPRP